MPTAADISTAIATTHPNPSPAQLFCSANDRLSQPSITNSDLLGNCGEANSLRSQSVNERKVIGICISSVGCFYSATSKYIVDRSTIYAQCIRDLLAIESICEHLHRLGNVPRNAASERIHSKLNQTTPDCTSACAENSRNLDHADSRHSQLLDFFNIKWRSVMKRSMVKLWNYVKISTTVIKRIAVPVVNILAASQFAAKFKDCNYSMLCNRFSVSLYDSIFRFEVGIAHDTSVFLPHAFALWIAEKSLCVIDPPLASV